MSDAASLGARPVFRHPQVNVYTGDIEKSLRFYRDLLGLPETFRTPKDGPPVHVELKLGSLTLGLATLEALERDHGISGGAGPPRGEVVLGVDDVDAAYLWITAQGAPSLSPPHTFSPAGSHRALVLRRANVADPDGNPVVFYTRFDEPPIAREERASESPKRPEFRASLVNLYVLDCERSVRFYCDLLGFVETFRTPKEGTPEHVEMELGPLTLGVATVEALKRHHGFSGGGGPPREEVVLWADDVDAAYAWLVARSVSSFSPPHNFAGVLRAAFISDPDGNPVQIVMRRGASEGAR